MEVLKYIVFISGYLLIVISLLPLIRKDNWFFRVFEYPRAQKLVLNVLILTFFETIADFSNPHAIVFMGCLVLNLLYLFYQIWPYTFFAGHQLHGTREIVENKHFSLLIFNVFQENRKVELCVDTIKRKDPDLVLLVETDRWWKEALDRSLEKLYPHQLGEALDNTYGIMLYSKFPLKDGVVRYLVDKEIPSIRTLVRLPSGEFFKLYGLHPQPPVPTENPRSTERDAEILVVGKEAKVSEVPVIVAGDLNDVAWSYTTELFMKVSGLLDPRRGRGFYNTFHAKHWFLRWPLDHIFCSEHFQLTSMKRLSAMGSDHFPILISLALKKKDVRKNHGEKLRPNANELKIANKKVKPAMRHSR
jgi:endonuclease/exonuclease/phosphatase (EEP) superfamily protein YafD